MALFEISIDIDKVIESLDLSKKRLMKNVTKSMDNIVKEGKTVMVREAPEGTGKLKKGIKTKVEKSSKEIIGTIDPVQEYAIYIEKGRGAGGRPPISQIQKWVRAKGLPEGAAFLIAKKIGKGQSGSNRPNPFIERTYNELESIIEDEINKAISRTAGSF